MNHRLQLFDTPESLAVTVVSFLVEGYNAGENIIVIAKRRHLDDISAALRGQGVPDPAAPGAPRLIALDANDVLQRLTREGRIDCETLQTLFRPMLQRLTATGRLRIYAEVVELLAEQGDLAEAGRIEEMWNELAAELPLTLLCGYSSAHFTAPTTRDAFRDICRAHSHATAASDDTLGSWLLAIA